MGIQVHSLAESLDRLHGATQEIRTDKSCQNLEKGDRTELNATKRLGDFEIGAAIASRLGQRAEARQLYDSALEMFETLEVSTDDQLESAEVDTAERLIWRSDLDLCYNNLGSIQSYLGAHELACRQYRIAIEVQEKLRRQAPAIVRYRSDLSVSWNNLGQALTQHENSLESDDAYEHSRSILAQLVEDYPEEVRYRSSLAGVLNNQAMALEHDEQLESALAVSVHYC